MNISNIGTFYFLSLGILFVLCCLLVYHFKRRLDLFEQKNDTIFEIVNNVLSEISSIKQKQNVLFMLAKSMPSTEGGAVEKEPSASTPVDLCTRVIETNIPDNIKDRKKEGDETEEEDVNEDEDEGEEEDYDEDDYEEEEDNEDAGEDASGEDNEDADNDNAINHMIHKYINYHPDTVVSSNIKKIKVVDDDEKIIDLTNNDNDSEETNEMSFTSHFSGYYEKNGSQNDPHNHMLDIDMRILNLHSLHQLHSNMFHNNSQPDLNIQILNDAKDLNNIVEILDDDGEDIYKDMPELESVEDNSFLTSVDYLGNSREAVEVDIDESNPIEYLDDSPAPNQDTTNVKEETVPVQTKEEPSEVVEIDVPEPVIDKLPATEPTDETISEDGFNFKKSEKLGGYRKLSVQALRELVVSKGLIQDASKLKKGEILMFLQNAL